MLFPDLVYAARSLRRSPAFSATAVVTIAPSPVGSPRAERPPSIPLSPCVRSSRRDLQNTLLRRTASGPPSNRW
jgi:hypothetical protein